MQSILSILNRPLPVVAKLFRDRRGAAAVLLAVALSGIVGFAGLGSEVASWYYTTRSMQGAVDSAASTAAATLASATSSGSTITGDQLRNAARSVASTFNFTNGTGSTTVTVNNPPATTTNLTTCGTPFTSFNCYVEVIISQPQTALLTAVFMSTGPTITARAVAKANTTATDAGCVVTLNRTASRALQNTGSGALTFTGCALYDNSNASDALYQGGSGSISTQAAYVVGGSSGAITATDGITTGVNPTNDPYAWAPSPTGYTTNGTCGYGSANGQGLDKLIGNNYNGTTKVISNSTTAIINPTSCSLFGLGGGTKNLHMTAGQTLVLCPGTYVFDNANLTMDGSSTLLAPPPAATILALCPGNTSGGVTIIFSNSTGGNPGIPNIGAQASVTLTAPTTGTYKGVAMFGDRLTCTGNGNSDVNGNGTACSPTMQGGGTQNVTGAVYFPKETVSYSGGASTGGATCTQLVADKINFTGGSTFNSNCSSAGTKTISYTNGSLVM
jgi:Flp pilus assembly protein TadG